MLVSTLGLEVFGKIVLTQLLMTYGVTIVDYGYNLIGVKKISVAKNENEIMKIISKSHSLKFLLSALSLILVPIGYFLIPTIEKDLYLILIGWINVIALGFNTTWIFQGIEKMYYIGVANFITKAMVMIALLVMTIQPEDYLLVFAILNGANLLNSILGFLILKFREKLNLFELSLKGVKQEFFEGKEIFLSNFTVQVYSNMVVLFSSGFLSKKEIGILGVFLKFRDIAFSIVGPVQQAVYPAISRFANDKAIPQLKKLVLRVLGILMLFMVVFVAGFLIFQDTINILFFDGELIGFRMEILVFLSIILTIPFGGLFTKVLASFEKYQWVQKTTFVSVLLCVAIFYPLLNYFEIIGVLLVIFISYLANSIMGAYYTVLTLKKIH